ncbi:OmpA family protein [uncultured Marixanthomonas sp.]|mgnify:CR=1 FL=1|uniref:OmpA family protein n=1 Tax=uncultured Marixanthomonas sp. TaxID=757245 RepID=UPI0030DA4122
MATGIKHIEFADPSDINWDNFLSFGNSNPNTNFIIRANKSIKLRAVYENETPLVQRNAAMWIKGPKTECGYTKDDRTDKIGDEGFLLIEPKFCGPQEFIIEAFLDQPTNRYPKQLTFRGYAPEKIISTKWSFTKGGNDIRGSKIKYGDKVWLNIQAEGLNGAQVTIEVYDTDGLDDKVSTQQSLCIEGEINIEFNDTFNWKSSFQFGEDKFYIKINKRGGNYIIDDYDDDEHARFLTIKNEESSREVASSTTERPLVIEQNQVNFERYELCRFEKITVTDQGDDVILFDQEKLQLDLSGKKSEFQVSETIHFDLDRSAIRADAKVVLGGIARLLMDNPKVPVRLGAHCDIRADHAYNDQLSLQRAQAAVSCLVGQGIDNDRISSYGYGKRRLLIEGEDISEEEHEINRRVTIEFLIFGSNAESIVFDTISGDTNNRTTLEFSVENHEVGPCIGKGVENAQHTKDVESKILTVDSNIQNSENLGDSSSFSSRVFSDMSGIKLNPFKYFWPHKAPYNQFQYHIHSCRYYSFTNIPTVLANVYPDIKWDFHFFAKLNNPLAVSWQGLNGTSLDRMSSVNGKVAAESRWKQSEAAFGAVLKASWNKISDNRFNEDFELTAKYEDHFKWLYKVFRSIRELSQGITKDTKGVASKKLGSKQPFTVEVVPPNFCLGVEWELARGELKEEAIKEIGTKYKVYLHADQLIGASIIIDLLGGALKAASVATTGNTVAADIVLKIREWAQKGYESENVEINFRVWFDLIITGEIYGEVDVENNTASDRTLVETELGTKLSVELTAGVELTAKVVIVKVGSASIEGNASAGAKLEIISGHQIAYDSYKGLYYKPKLTLPPCVAQVVVYIEVGLSYKVVSADWRPIDYNKRRKFWKKEIDIIKNLEDISGRKAEIELIKN